MYNLPKENIVPSKALKMWVYDLMKSEIINNNIPLGSRILESNFTTRYNVSRTPVRYAIRKLEADGFITTVPGKGIFATLPLLDDIDETIALRAVLTDLLLKHVVEKITEGQLATLYGYADEIDRILDEQADNPPFHILTPICRKIHLTMWDSAHMPFYSDFLQQLPDYWSFNCLSLFFPIEKRLQSLRQHRPIVDAVAKRDLPELKKLVHYHDYFSNECCIQAYHQLLQSLELK